MALIILTGVASFGLGRLSVLQENTPPVTIQYEGQTLGATTQKEVSATTVQTGVAAIAEAAKATDGKVVASKTGEVYHLPWCSGASRIKEENKIWFESAAAARAAGLRPAGNCKGLQ